MATSRLQGRRGDGSAAVRGWVGFYTLGLPDAMQRRRRDEVAGDLADETLDAVRRGELGALRRRRLLRCLLGIPADLSWRLLDAPPQAARIRASMPRSAWVPPSRWSLVLLAIVAVGTAGALALVLRGLLSGASTTWLGWGPYGVVVACLLLLVAVVTAVPWPGRAVAIGLPAGVLGLVAAPWLWGCWSLALIALLRRRHQSAIGSVRW